MSLIDYLTGLTGRRYCAGQNPARWGYIANAFDFRSETGQKSHFRLT